MVETLAKALSESRGSGANDPLVARISLLQDEVEGLVHEVRELKAAHDFDRKLLRPRETA